MTKKRKCSWILVNLGVCVISAVTIIPLILSTNSNQFNSSTNQNNDPNHEKDIPVVNYDNNATPYN